MPSFMEEPWSGDEKLVIGIDIGTTHTAVSYAHLYPGMYFIDSPGYAAPKEDSIDISTVCMVLVQVAHKS